MIGFEALLILLLSFPFVSLLHFRSNPRNGNDDVQREAKKMKKLQTDVNMNIRLI
jgi:hypothetical protein